VGVEIDIGGMLNEERGVGGGEIRNCINYLNH
jgi:hypothetical protein